MAGTPSSSRAAGGGITWTTAVDASGASLTGWVQDSGAWSVVAGALQVDTTAGTAARLRWDTAVDAFMTTFYLAVEINMAAAGVGVDAPAGLLWGWSGTGAGSYTGQLFKAGAGAGTKQVRAEYDLVAANLPPFTPSPTWALDAWHKLGLLVRGSVAGLYLNDVYVAQTQWTANQGFTAVRFVGLVCNNAVVNFRNFELSYLALPA